MSKPKVLSGRSEEKKKVHFRHTLIYIYIDVVDTKIENEFHKRLSRVDQKYQ